MSKRTEDAAFIGCLGITVLALVALIAAVIYFIVQSANALVAVAT